MKKLRFLQKRQTIRLMKTSIGFSTMAGCTMWFIWNIREGLEEIKTRRSGSDSIVAASILGRVSLLKSAVCRLQPKNSLKSKISTRINGTTLEAILKNSFLHC